RSVDRHGCKFRSDTRAASSRCRLIAMRIALLATIISIVICAKSASQSAGSVAPIGVYQVVPQLPGMGRPVDTAAVAARRRALLRRIGRGTVLIPAGHERNIEIDYVQDNDFRQDNTFFYLTQLETQDAWLLLTARGPDSVETVLFLPPRTPSRARFGGPRPIFTVINPRTKDEQRISDLVFSGADVRNVLPLVDSMRYVKD